MATAREHLQAVRDSIAPWDLKHLEQRCALIEEAESAARAAAQDGDLLEVAKQVEALERHSSAFLWTLPVTEYFEPEKICDLARLRSWVEERKTPQALRRVSEQLICEKLGVDSRGAQRWLDLDVLAVGTLSLAEGMELLYAQGEAQTGEGFYRMPAILLAIIACEGWDEGNAQLLDLHGVSEEEFETLKVLYGGDAYATPQDALAGARALEAKGPEKADGLKATNSHI